jgi:hypothetical protein
MLIKQSYSLCQAQAHSLEPPGAYRPVWPNSSLIITSGGQHWDQGCLSFISGVTCSSGGSSCTNIAGWDSKTWIFIRSYPFLVHTWRIWGKELPGTELYLWCHYCLLAGFLSWGLKDFFSINMYIFKKHVWNMTVLLNQCAWLMLYSLMSSSPSFLLPFFSHPVKKH